MRAIYKQLRDSALFYQDEFAKDDASVGVMIGGFGKEVSFQLLWLKDYKQTGLIGLDGLGNDNEDYRYVLDPSQLNIIFFKIPKHGKPKKAIGFSTEDVQQ